MSNDYFTNSTPVTRQTTARSSDINAMAAELVAAFDKLPAEAQFALIGEAYAETTGTNNAYEATDADYNFALQDGASVKVKFHATNTAAASLNVNSTGARAIKRIDGTDVEAGDLPIGYVMPFIYNGTNYVLMTVPPTVMAGAASNISGNITLSGNPSFPGDPTFSGDPTFTGSPDFSGIANAAAVRSALGLGGLATLSTVGTGQIVDSAVTLSKMAAFSVGEPQIGNSAISTRTLGNGQVTGPKLGTGAAIANIGWTPVQQGGQVGLAGNKVNIGWNAAGRLAYTVDGGTAVALANASEIPTVPPSYTDAEARTAQSGHSILGVGAYCFATRNGGDAVASDAVVSGAQLFPTGAAYRATVGSNTGNATLSTGGALPGNWRCMGVSSTVSAASAITLYAATLWLRVS